MKVKGLSKNICENSDAIVCVIYPNKGFYSETFIRAHIDRLPAKVKPIYGESFPCYDDADRPLFPPRSLFKRLRQGIERRAFKLPIEYFLKAALKAFLLENKVDAVLAEYGTTAVKIMDICFEARIPLIPHFHGFDAYDEAILDGAGKYYPQLFEQSEAIVVVSRDMQHQLIGLGAAREKLRYIPYGVDLNLFKMLAGNPIPPVFLAVGRFVDKKAPHLTILAFNGVLEMVPNARLLMIGGGPLLEGCKQLANALHISESIEFLGPQPHSVVAETMRKARVFVQHSHRTSYGDSEGTPVAILEAGATGLPVVATRHAGIQDVVIHGQTGFLVNEGDVKGMTEFMLQLAKDPALADRLGKAANNRIRTEFPIDKSIRKLWSIIQKAIDARSTI